MTQPTPTSRGDTANPQPFKHLLRAGEHTTSSNDQPQPSDHREHVEPWLSALLQAEHVNLLVGSGFTTAIANCASAPRVDMGPVSFSADYADAVEAVALSSAHRIGRTKPNFEDQARAAMEFIDGLRVLAAGTGSGDAAEKARWAASLLDRWTTELDASFSSLAKNILVTERAILAALTDSPTQPELQRLLGGFLLPFASRTATRERTHIFTTNYDRLIEYASDLLGLRIVDRFIGTLAPVFHSSRLGVDLHYNPPGIRGEPRYLEGVIRLTKLHGSVDWRAAVGPSARLEVQRAAVPFGAPDSTPVLPPSPSDQLLIYPNAAKDIETLEFPYAELFRDFSAALCQPNSVVVTYGYGFGDDHVNRVLRHMLTIPSTHIVIISYDYAGGRLAAFLEAIGHAAQVTLLVGPHFGDLGTLVEHYLPKPAIDRTTWRMVDLLNRRTPVKPEGRREPKPDESEDGAANPANTRTGRSD